ncbi:MAG TPA: aminotransferase class I/II-fold pyridoxal phosphate-dependent enzyme [Acidimicrobiia bacterium]|nr:aminotransferase class I/II-fold pyridoxal phosphate-dependent enzyme [Acidimicrobiia bacterium]
MKRNPVLDRLGTYPISILQEKARDMRARGEFVVDFSIGDPREPTPPFIPEALKEAVPVVSQYPTVPGLGELRGAVADYAGRRFGVEVDPDTQVLPTSGSKEAIFSTPLALVTAGAGQAMVFGTPGYPVYERGSLFAGADAVGIRLGGDFVLRAGDIPADVWRRAAGVWTCSPHNPTGAITDAADLAELLDACRANDALLLSDECYCDLYEDEAPPSALQVAGPGFANVVSYLSCSKRSGMTGYRSGAMVGDARAIAALREVRSSAGVASPEFVQAAAVAAWSDDAHAAERRTLFAAKRALLRQLFDELGYEVVGSRAGIYLWVAVEDDVALTKRLLDAGVVVSPGRIFGPGGEGYLRLALVPTLEETEQAVEVLKACLSPMP